MASTDRPRTTEERPEDALVAILSPVLDISAVWTGARAVVLRGTARDSQETTWEAVGVKARAQGWELQRQSAHPEWVVYAHTRRTHRFPWVPALLFGATLLSMTVLRPFWLAGADPTLFRQLFWEELPFALALLPILLAHEFGHYLAARAHHYPASLPYFLPGFPIFGTFGALIIARFPFPNRRVLFDVAVAGPIAGFIVCLPVLCIGMYLSEWVDPGGLGGMQLGDPLIMQWLSKLLLPPPPAGDMDLLLHPVAFAGWAGLFVTMLNLLPFGQLDGGRTGYALIRDRQFLLAGVAWALLLLSLRVTWFWSLWLVLALAFRLRHPPTLDDELPLGRGRHLVGVLVVLIFVVSFMPFPFRP